MKKITKSSLANGLQIVAILVLFGYPGRSSDKQLTQPSPTVISVTGDTAIYRNKSIQNSGNAAEKKYLLKQQSAEKAKYFLMTTD